MKVNVLNPDLGLARSRPVSLAVNPDQGSFISNSGTFAIRCPAHSHGTSVAIVPSSTPSPSWTHRRDTPAGRWRAARPSARSCRIPCQSFDTREDRYWIFKRAFLWPEL